MITTWLHGNDRLELHDEQGLLCSWDADTTMKSRLRLLAFLLNLFPAFGSQVVQFLRMLNVEQQR